MELIAQYFPDLNDVQRSQYQKLEALYKDWNEKVNVISRKDIDRLYEKHVLHSLALSKLIQFSSGAKVLDIGTGGGFPGLPLAIFFPDVEFTLVDSIGKKIKVVQDIATQLGLQNVKAIHARVETLSPLEFDYAVSRAVAPIGTLWKWVKPLLRKGRQTDEFANGLFCLKGGDLGLEISESGLRPHSWEINKIFEVDFFEEKYVLYVPR